jgi:hypothetical protein
MRDRVTVEYALRNTATPIGVAEFVTALPSDLAGSLPTVEQMEAELIEIRAETGIFNNTGSSATITVGYAEGEEQKVDGDNAADMVEDAEAT